MQWVRDLRQMTVRVEVCQHLDSILVVRAQHLQDPTPGLHLQTQDQVTGQKVLTTHCPPPPGLERHGLFLTKEGNINNLQSFALLRTNLEDLFHLTEIIVVHLDSLTPAHR